METQVLNWQDGVARVVNNRGLYAKLLGRFADSQAGAPAGIKAALDAGNLEDARHLTHTLKGTAANLGAEHLAEVSRILEEAIKDGGDGIAALAAVEIALQETLTAMKEFTA